MDQAGIRTVHDWDPNHGPRSSSLSSDKSAHDFRYTYGSMKQCRENGKQKKMFQGVQHEKIGPRSKKGRFFHDKACVLYLQEGIEVFYHDIFSVQAIESNEIALDFANLS